MVIASQNIEQKPGYKQTEIGLIPEDWEIKRLGEILTVRHGKSQHGIATRGGNFPILATSGEIGRTNYYLYDKPSVLIGRKGTIDYPQYMEAPFWTIDTLFYTEISRATHPKFVFYLFNMIDWRSYNEASGVPSLNASTIENIEVVLPTLREQRAIATALNDVDALIVSLDQLITKKRDIKQATMQQLLTGRIRLVEFSEKTEQSYKQTEMGLIPVDWSLAKLGDYTYVTKLAGFEYTSHFDYQKSGPIIAVRALNIKNGKLDLTEVHTLPKEISDLLPRSQLIKGDLVVSYVGTLGRVAVIPEDNKFHLAPNVAKIRVNLGQVDPYYLSQFLNGEKGQQAIFRVAASTTQAALSMHNLREVPCILPSFPEQQAIATVLLDMDAEIVALEQRREKTRELKQGMMQELLTGKTRLL